MNVRHLYLKIEAVPNYSPIAPDDAEHHKHRLDCMRNMDHADATIKLPIPFPHGHHCENRSTGAWQYRASGILHALCGG